jgi:hypothetical protein
MAILDCLGEDARIKSTEIAKRLGNIITRAIRIRLDRPIREGYITITAMAVPEKLEFLIVLFSFVGANMEGLQTFIFDKFHQIPKVQEEKTNDRSTFYYVVSGLNTGTDLPSIRL